MADDRKACAMAIHRMQSASCGTAADAASDMRWACKNTGGSMAIRMVNAQKAKLGSCGISGLGRSRRRRRKRR